MENKYKLAKEILDLGPSLGLEIKEFSWPRDNSIHAYDVEVSFSNQKSSPKGRGLSVESFEDALLCAVGECIERLCFHASDLITTNGMAFYSDESGAKQRAMAEFLERDAFFVYFLINRSPPVCREAFSYVPKDIDVFLAKEGVHIDFYLAELVLGFPTVMCVLRGEECCKQFGLFLGSSCNSDLSAAVRKSLLEALMSYVIFRYSSHISTSSYKRFQSLKNWGPNDHRELYANIDFISKWPSFFDSEVFVPEPKVLKTSEMKFRSFNLPELFNALNTSSVVQCSSDFYQSLFFGPTMPEYVNFARLSQVLDRVISFEDVNQLPHPYP